MTFKEVIFFLMLAQRSLHSRVSEKMQDTHPEYYSWDGMPFIMKKFSGLEHLKFETAVPAANLKMKQRTLTGLSTADAIPT